MKSGNPLMLMSAGLVGLLIGWRDVIATGDDAPQLTLMLLLLVGGLFGLIRPDRPWRWALALAIGLPLLHLALRALGHDDHFRPDSYAARLALLPVALLAASVGAYAAAGVRRLLGTSRREA